jgi:hypothetical protein
LLSYLLVNADKIMARRYIVIDKDQLHPTG